MTRYPHWQRRHEAVLQWLLSHHTGKLYECARDTGYSPWHLSRIINSQHFQAVYRGEIEKQRRSSSIRRKFRGRSRYCDQQRTAGEWVIIATTGLNMEKNGSMDARTYVATHTLKNGVEITIRAIRSEDKRKLLEAFKQLDRSSIYTRFFGHKKSLSEAELERATNLDFHATVALVATMGHGEDEAIVGGGRYSTGGSGSSQRSAEVAFTVEEDYQGLGIASLLFGHLVRIARAQGLSRLEADVLAVNQSMLKVFRRSGLPMDQRAEGDTVHIVLQLDSAGQ